MQKNHSNAILKYVQYVLPPLHGAHAKSHTNLDIYFGNEAHIKQMKIKSHCAFNVPKVLQHNILNWRANVT